MPEDLCTEVHIIVQKAGKQNQKNIPKKKEKEEGKVVFWRGFTNIWGRSEKQERKGKAHQTKCRVPENSKERQEGLQWTMQRNRGKQQKGKDQRFLKENWKYQRNISSKDVYNKIENVKA